ncbi:hypothetical protein QS468_42790 [Bacillus subtilis]|uniref:DUF6124 family protein n=1 Tax=Pseudomonas sp. MWU12-2029 TaxID=2927805 RepID=UPI00200CF9BF|nr:MULTISPECIES: hypothetical protein [unclassified Pseudomonas]MDL5599503.1 hypothetical protein [Bacillus subtilis]
MKKDTPDPSENSPVTESRTISTSERPITVARRRNSRLLPVDQIFSVRPDADLVTLLTHASQNLAALNMMAHDLVHRPDEVQRARIVAMHQLAGLAEMLVSSALSKLDPLQQAADSKPVICH